MLEKLLRVGAGQQNRGFLWRETQPCVSCAVSRDLACANGNFSLVVLCRFPFRETPCLEEILYMNYYLTLSVSTPMQPDGLFIWERVNKTSPFFSLAPPSPISAPLSCLLPFYFQLFLATTHGIDGSSQNLQHKNNMKNKSTKKK